LKFPVFSRVNTRAGLVWSSQRGASERELEGAEPTPVPQTRVTGLWTSTLEVRGPCPGHKGATEAARGCLETGGRPAVCRSQTNTGRYEGTDWRALAHSDFHRTRPPAQVCLLPNPVSSDPDSHAFNWVSLSIYHVRGRGWGRLVHLKASIAHKSPK
jgi:hypothetical protein